MLQASIFDLEDRLEKLDRLGDPLKALNDVVDWTIFIPILKKGLKKGKKSNAGRPPFDAVAFGRRVYQAGFSPSQLRQDRRLSWKKRRKSRVLVSSLHCVSDNLRCYKYYSDLVQNHFLSNPYTVLKASLNMTKVWGDSQVQILEDNRTIALIGSDGKVHKIVATLDAIPDNIRGVTAHVGVANDRAVLDFSVVKLEKPCIASAAYTRSLCVGPAVELSRENTNEGYIQLICVISKNAMVFAENSKEDILAVMNALAKEFDVDVRHILISCTGIIGRPLPLETVLSHIPGLSKQLSRQSMDNVSKAILTTDKRPKVASIQCGNMRVIGYAKGAGMIEPNMATMLSYLYTNVDVSKSQLDIALSRAVARTFNSISVDSDTSTSDTVSIVTTGSVSCDDLTLFEEMLQAVCLDLARKIAMEAEGANKLIEVKVSLPTTIEDAKFFAKKIINSPLVKTAVHGNDPNWGRIVMAIGKPTPGSPLIPIDRKDVCINIQGMALYEKGRSNVNVDTLGALSQKMRDSDVVTIEVSIGQPYYSATVWGCDLSAEYVRENADYSS
ncbi:MAG: bifunctional glutamate N-acetyltransferase/amino-acid acetyltransferase ArgJ [Pseudomonadota bacterium]